MSRKTPILVPLHTDERLVVVSVAGSRKQDGRGEFEEVNSRLQTRPGNRCNAPRAAPNLEVIRVQVTRPVRIRFLLRLPIGSRMSRTRFGTIPFTGRKLQLTACVSVCVWVRRREQAKLIAELGNGRHIAVLRAWRVGQAHCRWGGGKNRLHWRLKRLETGIRTKLPRSGRG
jgi:hypothetical protein